MRTFLAMISIAVLAAFFLSSQADAKSRGWHKPQHHATHHRKRVRHAHRHHLKRYAHRNHGRVPLPVSRPANLASVISPLVAKAQEIVSSCGSVVVSGFRPGARVAGSGRPSLHASGHAVDIQGNPGCIYSMLHGWPGGFSTDYSAVRHVHISLHGREDGLRFSHHTSRHGGRYARRYRHQRTRYARA